MPGRQPDLPSPTPLGVTVMPEWFACEGIERVLDNVQALGATAIATSPYVLEVAPDGEGGREPPVDAGAGRVRPLDRPLFGRRELWVRTAPAFEHDFARYAGLPYQPSPPTALTARHAGLLDDVVEACGRRGVAVLLQVMAASPPGYRVQFSGARAEDRCLGPDGRPHEARVDRNASLASGDVARYAATLVAELASRYPGVAGFRLDWPEYPPYDFASALFDFNPAMQARMAARGDDPARVARDVVAWAAELRAAVTGAAARGEPARALAGPPWTAMLDASGPLAPLFAAKRDAVLALLRTVRSALDAVPGPRRRLEPQAFPPPFPAISGFPLDGLAGVADAVGIKLYTMHWPMIARFWASQLAGDGDAGVVDATAAALAEAFGFTDGRVDGASLRYPEPHERHPAGTRAQRDKLAAAQALAGDVPVVAFAHTYGPVDDVVARCVLAGSAGRPLWLNRYGYLSDAKLRALAAALRESAPCATSGR
jgi:hypothetical protein